MNYDQIAVLIPAYKPDERLIQLVDELRRSGFERVVTVDDGGGEAYRAIFEALDGKAQVLIHEVNRGKGAALKTGLAHIARSMPGVAVVTADADGQHTPSDIARVAERLLAEPESLVLGSRDKKQMPPRSKAGNTLTCAVFGLTTGLWISDTQTGLRGLPAGQLEAFSRLEGDRYEYEMNMLIDARKRSIPVREVTIDTIYIDDNASSHFSALKDGMRIYKLLFRQVGAFVGSSLISALVDYVMFLLLRRLVPDSILVAVVVARSVSSLVNYFINREVVFRVRDAHGSFLKYYLLVGTVALLNYLGILGLTTLGVKDIVAKVIMDTLLFILSYLAQNRLIFKKN